jgi:hypothetical protein
MSDTITTPDGVTLGLRGDPELDGMSYPAPVKYRGWDIHFADYNKTYGEAGCWEVIGDLRREDADYNPDIARPIEEKARGLHIEVEGDHETSCSYFYLPTLADAKRLVEVIEADG